nr:hypothetical protein GCM10020185_86910 [Pseudomonas brassicacearum subsp. brassicacearum]
MKRGGEGDGEYDHIVPVIGVSSTKPVTQPATYYADDVITFSDNGLWSPNGKPAYLYRFKFGAFQANREEANDESRPVYSLPGGGKKLWRGHNRGYRPRRQDAAGSSDNRRE